jgi:ATP-binding cassette subfamily B protein RtxB
MFQQPLNQLTSLWQEFLQTKIAIERLSSILNTPAEKKKISHFKMPPLNSDVTVNSYNICFLFQ